MKANELRLGNLVNTINREGEIHLPNSKVFSVQEIGFDCILCEINKIPAQERTLPVFAVRDLCPIPLTAEWLEKFGFNKFPNQKKYDMDNFWACKLRNGNEWHFEDLECFVKYVHQLQNLFFALTGEELTIKS